tara:strand:- start:136 stop:441 length:306 start_codon:yes stop_codon:yes gene_type:complete
MLIAFANNKKQRIVKGIDKEFKKYSFLRKDSLIDLIKKISLDITKSKNKNPRSNNLVFGLMFFLSSKKPRKKNTKVKKTKEKNAKSVLNKVSVKLSFVKNR